MFTVFSGSPAETRAWGTRLAKGLFAGAVVALEGQLGGGKTVFVQGVAQGLGIAAPVTSPTFILIREYHQGRLPLYHVDAYRLDYALELEFLGLDEVLGHDGVVLIEWADKLGELLPSDYLEVRFEHSRPDYPQVRTLTFNARGNAYQEILQGLMEGAERRC